MVAVLVVTAGPTTAQIPARDTSARQPGTATVSGVVTTGEAPGRPLRRVTVTLQSASLRAPISAMTGDDGRFELPGVVAGSYTVTASRQGYVNTVLGAPPGSIMGAPIAVSDGEQVSGVAIHVPRGGVITGVVRFPSGRPARDVQVQVSSVRQVNGQRQVRLSPGLGGASTDDRGVFRHFGLAPGEYVVQLVAGVGPAARRSAVRRTSPDEVAWAERLAADQASVAPGVTAATGPAPGRTMTLAPVYYPGTTRLETAQVIPIAAGEERSGIDLVMEYVPAVQISGVVRAPDGSPQAGATVRLNSESGSGSVADVLGALVGQGARTDATGAFALDAVPPGDYTLSAEVARPADPDEPEPASSAPNLMSMFSTMFGRGGGAGAWHATAPVVVTGSDIDGVELRLAEGATLSGRIVVEGTTDPPAPSSVQVMLTGVAEGASTMEQAMSMLGGSTGQVAADLTFVVRGVAPDRYRVTANMPGTMFGTALPNATWFVKSVVGSDGSDLADVPFDVTPGRDIDGIVVTITDQPTVLSGTVIDGEGRPSSAFPILVFSTNPAHWIAGSRRVQQARPADDGTYRIAGLPAGDYYVGAVTTLELDDLFDPSFLQQIVPIAFTITLADGEQKTQDLRFGTQGHERSEGSEGSFGDAVRASPGLSSWPAGIRRLGLQRK